ncbi:SDR family NAD(P)-dependent oxidoreductase [Actinomadura sp. NEAU-AAG7]|uniref:SDR family NAD(P)-dependent oxidoreductase n=1 Tax=Actinomadura sp. NEAU-AAG7 TaxID=2839640 RepID=UPI001BE3D7E4|nr:SDR family NAD(P)-dependent oxidoreductase [Actinomadura sp. NEAU-AAG7]MBT2212114.1 SDR family NAD(P)-dependent oxidoreductase [Actinomadura sp. NEAU-AAG7]
MKNFVITGGTDGMGRALGLTYLERGDAVAVVGRDAGRGAAFLDAARRLGAAERARFVRADLSVMAETRGAVQEVRAHFAKVDALVLCARHFRSTRLVTAEGFENTFAHFYLSRFLMSYEMTDLLDAADRPVILNVAGPGPNPEAVRWDDLGRERDYDGQGALMQGGLLNDLLGTGYVRIRPSKKVRYVLYNPGSVATALSGEYHPRVAAQIEIMRRHAQPVDKAIVPMLDLLDDPPAEPLSAVVMGRPIPLDGPGFDPGAARRLHDLTRELLAPTP